MSICNSTHQRRWLQPDKEDKMDIDKLERYPHGSHSCEFQSADRIHLKRERYMTDQLLTVIIQDHGLIEYLHWINSSLYYRHHLGQNKTSKHDIYLSYGPSSTRIQITWTPSNGFWHKPYCDGSLRFGWTRMSLSMRFTQAANVTWRHYDLVHINLASLLAIVAWYSAQINQVVSSGDVLNIIVVVDIETVFVVSDSSDIWLS
jgi:hypothetical protein